jgi:very-short-patch-repair endonuclease
VVPVVLALEHAFRCLRPEWALAIVDSALHSRQLRPDALTALAARLPAHLAVVARSADGRAESGVESIARYLLVLLGLRVEVQVVIDGVGRVDLLVEGRLIIELDGRAWHDDPAAFARDRRRDAAAVIGRHRVLRFDYRQVLFEWPTVEAPVLAALAA